MKKIISFSVYGNQPKYSVGMLSNVLLAKQIYPDWICRIYYDNSVDQNIIHEISKNDNIELINMTEEGKEIFPMLWRFLAIDDPDVDIMLSRDSDSRLSYREKYCVDIFTKSDFILHSIRDNLSHNNIMGGMWGIKKNNRIKIRDLVNKWGLSGYDADQQFLRSKVVPFFLDSYLIHCRHYLNTFPIEPQNEYFVGGWWDENNFQKPLDYVFF